MSSHSKASSGGVLSVLAVVVAHNPDEGFEETLESLTRQDYEQLSVVIVDTVGRSTGVPVEATPLSPDNAGSSDMAATEDLDDPSDAGDLKRRVRSVIREAAIITAPGVSGFSAAVNTVLSTDLHASFLLLCHDDMVLEPDTVTKLVEQAKQNDASLVGPKLMHKDQPEIIESVGYEVDRFGAKSDMTGSSELDQEQHDSMRDAFAISTAAMLIDKDIFVRIGGCDPAMKYRGYDVDLCWRARMAGARVIVAGDAKVHHRGRIATSSEAADDHFTFLNAENLRSMLINHGRISLLIFMPLALLISVAEIILAVFTGRIRRVRTVFADWTWNLTRLTDVLKRRRANARVRQVRQADVAALQYLGSIRLTSFMRQRFDSNNIGKAGGFFSSTGRGLLNCFSIGQARVVWLVWVLIVSAVLFGSRSLIISGVSAVGDFASFPSSADDLLNSWWSGWSERETGAPSSNLGGLFWLGALGFLLELIGGSMGLVRTLWVLTPVFVGLIGIYHMMSRAGSYKAQLGALIAYSLIPLAPASIASGSIAGLVAYAVAPWFLGMGFSALGITPFGADGVVGSKKLKWYGGLLSDVWRLGLCAGIASLFVPSVMGLLIVTAAGLIIGSLQVGRLSGIFRLLVATVASLLFGLSIVFPFTVDMVVAGPDWQLFADGRDGSAMSVSLSEILTFTVGPNDKGLRVWFLFIPMFLPLLLGRKWRFDQSVRFWMVALVSWGLAFASQHGILGVGLPDVHLLIAPAAAAAAGLCGMAVLSVEHDLRMSHFSYRQFLVPIAAAGLVLLAMGTIGILEDGRWGLVGRDHQTVLRFESEDLSGDYRVLWIGVPEFLGVEGRHLDNGLAWAVTSGGRITIADRSITADPGMADPIKTTLEGIVAGDTIRGGRCLADFGVRYVVLVHRLAPAPFPSQQKISPAVSSVWIEAFNSQLDMQQVQGINSALTLLNNTSWAPSLDLVDVDIGNANSMDGITFAGPTTSDIAPSVDLRDTSSVATTSTDFAEKDSSCSTAELLENADIRLSYSSPWWRKSSQIFGVAVLLVLISVRLRSRMTIRQNQESSRISQT